MSKPRSGGVSKSIKADKMWAGDQREIVAREAYLSAEKRGFNGGDPVQDWLEAEKKVGEILAMTD